MATDTRVVSEFCLAVVEYINEIRTDPGSFAEKIKRYFEKHYFLDEGRSKNYFVKTTTSKKGTTTTTTTHTMQTREGKPLVDEAIRILQARAKEKRTFSPLAPDLCLQLSAQDVAMIPYVGHLTDKKRSPTGFIWSEYIALRGGEFTGKRGENLSWGPIDPFLIVMGLYIDDGVPDRGHRHSLETPEFRFAGAHLDISDHHAHKSKTCIHLTSKKTTRCR